MPLCRALLILTVLTQVACGGRPASPADRSSTGATHDVWIRDVTVISPERSGALPHAHVLLRGGRIAWVDTAPPPAMAPGVTAIDGAGRYLVPGLIDGHVHLAEIPGLTDEQRAAMPAVVESYFRQLPRSYLYFGFTTVVDLNVVDRARVDGIVAAPIGPAVFDCGNALALANGYPMSFLPKDERFSLYPNFLYDARHADAIPPAFSAAEHTPAAAVGRVAAGGGICVKAHHESGFGKQSGQLPTPTVELLRDVLAESHRRRLPLLLHANSLSAHRFAVAVGVDAVVHGLWNWETDDIAQGLPPPIREVLDDEQRAGIGMMPTSRVVGGLEDLFAPEFLDDPELANVLPPELLAWYRSDAGKWFARDLAGGFEGLPVERVRHVFRGLADAGLRAASYFSARGGRLLFGSDTPSAPSYANPPGYNGYLEMRALERAGIPPRQILAAATLANAKLFGLAADYGTIEPGKRASLLLLHADPQVSVTAFDTIEVVFIAGRVLARAELTARPRS